MQDLAWKLTSIGQLALLLEASSPKPGNVSRVAEFSDTSYRHFLASSALMARALHESARRGIALATGDLKPGEVGLGGLIHSAVSDTIGGLNKRNTILGSILLYIPLMVAIAATVQQEDSFSVHRVRANLDTVLEHTSVEDAVLLYRSFQLAQPGGEMIKREPFWTDVHDRYDMHNPEVIENIREDGVTLLSLFRLSAPVDEIAEQWATGFRLILDEAFPHLDSLSATLEDLEEAVVRTFVWLLSKRPDGLIVKKAGLARAEAVRSLAARVLDTWDEGIGVGALLEALDKALRNNENSLNPGTTADFLAAAILCKIASMEFSGSSSGFR
jgi:triphosphoribosyl-dephospho-CoA synthase